MTFGVSISLLLRTLGPIGVTDRRVGGTVVAGRWQLDMSSRCWHGSCCHFIRTYCRCCCCCCCGWCCLLVDWSEIQSVGRSVVVVIVLAVVGAAAAVVVVFLP